MHVHIYTCSLHNFVNLSTPEGFNFFRSSLSEISCLIINVFSPDVWNLNRCVEYWLKTSETESSWKLVQQSLSRCGNLIFMLGHVPLHSMIMGAKGSFLLEMSYQVLHVNSHPRGHHYMTKSKPVYYREILQKQNLPYICIKFDFSTPNGSHETWSHFVLWKKPMEKHNTTPTSHAGDFETERSKH